MSQISDWPTSSEILFDHPIVGSIIWFNTASANSSASTLRDAITALQSIHGPAGLRATIAGVFVQNCQIAGYKVTAIDGSQHTGGTGDFRIDHRGDALSKTKNRIIDHAVMSTRIRNIVRHWQDVKEYNGSYWIGIEKIYNRLAHVIAMGAVKGAHSTRSKLHWRFILPVVHNPVAVDFHTTTADNAWSVATSVQKTEFDSIYLTGHPDPWKRGMMWTLRTLETLEDRKAFVSYRRERQDIITRMGLATILHEMKIPLLAQLQHTHEKLFGETTEPPEYITIVVSEWSLPPGKQSFYMPPHYDTDLGWIFWGTLVMHPDLAGSPKLARPALIHQLAHSIFATSCDNDCEKNMTPVMRELILSSS